MRTRDQQKNNRMMLQYIQTKKNKIIMQKISLSIITFCLFLITDNTLFGQKRCSDTLFRKNVDPISIQLTKEQMYEDYDMLVQIISSSTHNLVNKVSTGYDAEVYLKKRRPEVEDIFSYQEFMSFLEKSLPFLLTPICYMADKYSRQYARGSEFIDTAMVNLLSDAYFTNIFSSSLHHLNQLGIGFYYNGDYYVSGRYVFIHSNTNDTLVLSNFRILKQEPSLKDIFESQVSISASSIHWDYRLKKHYVTDGLYIPRSDKILAEDYLTKQQFYFSPIDYFTQKSGVSLSQEEILSLPREKSDKMKVTYYDSLQLLYSVCPKTHKFISSMYNCNQRITVKG
jgi:hypothetical protein